MKIPIYLVALFLIPLASVFSRDLDDKEFGSLMGLVDRVSKNANMPPQINPITGDKMVDYERFQLAYTVIYLAENGYSGVRLADFFEAIHDQLGGIKLPNSIKLYSNYKDMVGALAQDAMNKDPKLNVVANSVPYSILGENTTFSVLTAQAQGRISKESGYEFKRRKVLFNQ